MILRMDRHRPAEAKAKALPTLGSPRHPRRKGSAQGEQVVISPVPLSTLSVASKLDLTAGKFNVGFRSMCLERIEKSLKNVPEVLLDSFEAPEALPSTP